MSAFFRFRSSVKFNVKSSSRERSVFIMQLINSGWMIYGHLKLAHFGICIKSSSLTLVSQRVFNDGIVVTSQTLVNIQFE